MYENRIVVDPQIRFGKPCIKGTRIAVSDILNLIAAGYSLEDIPKQYPDIAKEDVVMAIEYASEFMEHPSRVISQLQPTLMTILTDECVNRDVIEALESGGFKVIRVSEASLGSVFDEEIFHYAVNNKYILLTFDRDFGNILRFDIASSAGIIVVHIEDMRKDQIIKNTLNLFKKFNESQLKGKLFIVERDRIRIWPK